MSKEDYDYWMPISIRLQATDKHFFYSIDYDNSKNIGFIWFGEYPDFPEKVILLYHIYVAEEYRGKKIAKEALNELHSIIFNEGYNEIYLNVSKSNFAIKLYESLGYKVFREFETNYHMSLKK